MITIAGSGPSASQLKRATVATKKRPIPSDYVFCRFAFTTKADDTPLMCYYRHGDGLSTAPIWYCDSTKWNAYWKRFVRSKRPPQRTKPSTGLCAVFAVVERWNPNEIGLIGFDYVLDGNTDWEHDAIAERECIMSLVKVKDLRNES